MHTFYYCLDGQTVVGPHNSQEMQELLADGIITHSTSIIIAGEKDWKKVSDFPELSTLIKPSEVSSGSTSIDLAAVHSVTNDTDEEEVKEKVTRRASRNDLLRAIRTDLNLVWDAQRESIIARISNKELEAGYETTRKQHKQIKQRVEQAAIEYWRRSGVLDEWIDEITKDHADIQLRFKTKDNYSKFDEAKNWLQQAKLWECAACYAFKQGKEYVYIGQASNLGQRLTQHRATVHFNDADYIRIIIPYDRRHLGRLERMLILNYNPRNNDKSGANCGSSADNCLDFIRREIDSLITDE